MRGRILFAPVALALRLGSVGCAGAGDAPPPSTPLPAAPSPPAPSPKGLAPAAVGAVMASLRTEFRGCYDAAQARSPGLEGTIEMLLSIAASGDLRSAGGTVLAGDSQLTGCIVAATMKAKFPAAEGPTRMMVPLRLPPE